MFNIESRAGHFQFFVVKVVFLFLKVVIRKNRFLFLSRDLVTKETGRSKGSTRGIGIVDQPLRHHVNISTPKNIPILNFFVTRNALLHTHI